MRVILYTLLILQLGCCTDERFETKTVNMGEDVTLSCYNTDKEFGTFFWIKVVPEKMPEILEKGYGVGEDMRKISPSPTEQSDRKLTLQISKAKPSDSAFYYCLKYKSYNITFLKTVFLEIRGSDSDLPVVVQSSVDPVSAGDVVVLQCSVLSEFKKNTCPEEQRVFWFRKTEGESHPSYIYIQRSSDGECGGSTEAQSLQSCVYSFLKNVRSSDAGLYYCAVAACGKIIFGNGTKLDVQVDDTHDAGSNNIFFFLFLATLVFSVMTATFLICVVSKQYCAVCQARLPCSARPETDSDERQNQERNQDNVVYATTVFPKKKARGRKPAEKKEIVYSDVRVNEDK